jgi:hypothetical protein
MEVDPQTDERAELSGSTYVGAKMMMNTTSEKAIRELDRRTNDGIDVRLLWNSVTDQIVVAVHDARTLELFELPVAAGDALFAFHHPYAYASCPRTPHSLVL